MALDYYGSYTNNDLIYEAVTGQTRDPTEGPNKFTPLNTPIIDASICEKFAIINMFGTVLRFVSLDNGTTTPLSSFTYDSSKIKTIKEGLIYDILLPDGIIATKVVAINYAVLFMTKEERYLYSIVKSAKNYLSYYNTYHFKYNNTIDLFYVSVFTTYYNRENYGNVETAYAINPSDKIEADGSEFCLLADTNSSQPDLFYGTFSNLGTVHGYELGSYYTSYTPNGYNSNQAKWVSMYGSNCLFVDMNGNIKVRGTFKYFNPIDGSHGTDSDTYTYSDFAQSTLFTGYSISKAWIYGNSIIALTTNDLLLVVGDNRDSRLTPFVDDNVITTPYVTNYDNVYSVIIDKKDTTLNPTSYTVVPTTLSESDGKLNILQRANSSSDRLSNLTQIAKSVGLGRLITKLDFYHKEPLIVSKSNETVYFKWDVSIPQHSEYDSEIQVTLGPYIEWEYDPDLLDE